MHTKLLETMIQNSSPTSTTSSDSTSSSSLYSANNSSELPNAKRIKMTSSPPPPHPADSLDNKLNSILVSNLLNTSNNNNQINQKIFIASNNEPNRDLINKQRRLTPVVSNSSFFSSKTSNTTKKFNLENTILKLSQQQHIQLQQPQIIKPILTPVVSSKSQPNSTNKNQTPNETSLNNIQNRKNNPDTIAKSELVTPSENITKDEHSIDDNTVSSTTTTTTSLDTNLDEDKKMETNENEVKGEEEAPIAAPKPSAPASANGATKKAFACLRNLGSTCYINCIIQVMRYTPGFVLSIHRLNKQIDYLRSLNTEIDNELMGNNDIIFVKNLHELLVEMSDKEKLDRRPIYTPRKFVNTVWTSLNFWSDGSQQDAHEFLQYTIHFINECDLFIRKTQQKYQLKQIPASEICSLTASSSYTSSTSSNQSKQTLATVASNPELISANKVGTRSSARVASSSNLKAQTDSTNINGPCTRRSALKNSQTEQPTIVKQEEPVTAKLKLEEDTVKQEPNENCNKIEQLPIRLIKSMPKLKETSSENNFMRTPTKGGASAYNIAMITDTLTSNQSTTTTNESASVKEVLLTQAKTTRPVGRPSKQANKNKNDKVLNKLEVNSIHQHANKKPDDDHYTFRGEEEENQKSIFDLNKQSEEKTSEEKRSPIKVKFQMDNQTEKYKIVSSSSGTAIKSPKQIDDKDLVSKRLKETVNHQPASIKPADEHIPVFSLSCLNKNNKKLKAENIIEKNLLLNNSDIDSNSFIIIDSDTDEDVLNESNLNHAHNLILKNSKRQEENEIVDVELIEVEAEAKNATKNNGLSESESDFIYVSEESNLGKAESKNVKLKSCFVMLERLDVEKLSKSPTKQANEAIILEAVKTTKPGLRKFKSKSKTFPQPIQETEPPQPAPITSVVPTPAQNLGSELDAITLVNTVKSINLNYNASTSPTIKSKLRSASSQSSLTSPLPPPPAKSPLNNNVLAVANTASTLSPLPPSPAELLRKYSTSIGYVCEMDKLFKGSSLTVTQCLGCENLRKCPEAFYDRSIPLDTNDTIEDDDESNGVDWISKCLSNESYLNENSKYMCDICASKQEAKIHTQYTQMPNILILHLLSYGITSSVDGNLNAQKLSNRSRLVNYFDYCCTKENPRLSSGEFFKSPISTRRQMGSIGADPLQNQFKLFAVVMHSGVSLNSGHYTAFVNYKIVSESANELDGFYTRSQASQNEKMCSCFIENSSISAGKRGRASAEPQLALNQPEWLHFDDTKVKSLSSVEFHRKIVDSSYDSPYILFYVKG